MFWIEGIAQPDLNRGPYSARVTWTEPAARRILPRGLDGDLGVVQRAIRDELDGRTFRSTATGPYFLADFDDPVAALVQLASYFVPGYYSLGGDVPSLPPLSPSPEGAIP